MGVYIFINADAGVVGLVWGSCALPDLVLTQSLRKPISEAVRRPTSDNPTIRRPAIRRPTNRRFDNLPCTKGGGGGKNPGGGKGGGDWMCLEGGYFLTSHSII